jgi:oxygen-independent coproporphyrinogen-3 oxidase
MVAKDFMTADANNNCDNGTAASTLEGGGADRAPSPDMIRHLYVHIPFCARICPYCAFYKDLLDRSQTGRFVEAISAELRLQVNTRQLRPETIYFGGGTPTALTTGQLEKLLVDFRQHLDLSALAEWTMEANPGSVSARKADLLRRGGVSRISLGVQSWDDDLLRVLGREHNASQAADSFRILRRAGFQNINVDLMFGLPGQTTQQWRTTLEQTIALQPEHVSAYCLTFEEDTEFFLRQQRGELRNDSDFEAELFEMGMTMLQTAGYQHYEISNYARPGFESAHNRGYWAGDDYLGLGPSAFSTIGMQRWQNLCDYRSYSDRVLGGSSTVGAIERLTNEAKRLERVGLALRTREGIPAELVRDRATAVAELLRLGLLRTDNQRLVLTTAGKSVADSVAAELI